jgi:hypothetical protein
MLTRPPVARTEALISAREEELNRTRLDARQLTALLRTSPDQVRVTELVEILTGPEVVVQRWMQMQRAARQSLEVFIRPPFAQPNLEDDGALQDSLSERGGIAGPLRRAGVGDPGDAGRAAAHDPSGEEARVISSLPVELALFDRRAAFVPLTPREPHATLVVHESALLAAGLKDDAIARRLGVSTNTVRRRITARSQRLGVSTRFQIGLALGRKGWPA